jgi:hypothetical protein
MEYSYVDRKNPIRVEVTDRNRYAWVEVGTWAEEPAYLSPDEIDELIAALHIAAGILRERA